MLLFIQKKKKEIDIKDKCHNELNIVELRLNKKINYNSTII